MKFEVLLLLFGTVTALVAHQNTLYLYQNNTVYAHLRDDGLNVLFKIPFGGLYSSGDVLTAQIATPNNEDCELTTADSSLYALCPNEINNNTVLQVQTYDASSNTWDDVQLQSNITYFANETYIHSQSDNQAIYIFSGVDPETDKLSDRMLRLDTRSWKFSNAMTSVQPTPFQGATGLEINSNTQMLVGGSTDTGIVSIDEIPVWQYNSWAERPCSTDTSSFAGMIGALVLPVFQMSNPYVLNYTADFQVSSVLILGGTDEEGEISATNIAFLNVSSNIWELYNETQALEKSYSNNNLTHLDLNDILGAVTIYDTIFVISDSTKRDQEFTLNLFSINNFTHVDSINYSKVELEKKISSHNINKKMIVALSVVIPILVIIIASCFILFYYKKYLLKKEQELNEKEVTAIVDFYENQHKQFSTSTFETDSTYKSSSDFLPNSPIKVLINDYDNDDNISFGNRRSSSVCSNLIRSLTKKLPPVPKHIYMNHNPNHNLDYSYPSLNHIPENLSVSTFLTSSTGTKRESFLSANKVHLHSLSLQSDCYDMSSQSSPSKISKTSYLYHQQNNSSDGSINESAYSMSLMNMMRRMSSKRKNMKLRLTNPDVIDEQCEDVDDKVSLVEMNRYLDPFEDMRSDIFRNNTIYYQVDETLDPFSDLKSDIFRGDSIRYPPIKYFSNEENEVNRKASLKTSHDDPFFDMRSDIFRGDSVRHPIKSLFSSIKGISRNVSMKTNHGDPFSDLQSDIFRGDSIKYPIKSSLSLTQKIKRSSSVKTSYDDPFYDMSNDVFRGQSIKAKIDNSDRDNISTKASMKHNFKHQNDTFEERDHKRCISTGSSTFGIEYLEEHVSRD